MNEFTKSEIKGRTLLEEMLDQFNATDLQPTEDQYNPVDYYFKLKDKSVVAEIKVRDTQYENYDTHLMEVSKFNALVTDRKEKDLDVAYYVCFFGEDVAYWYSTYTISKYATTDSFYCNRTTAINSGKKKKNLLMIPRSKGTKFIKVNGQWNKQEN